MTFRDPTGDTVGTRGNFECGLPMQSNKALPGVRGHNWEETYTETHKEVSGRVKTLMLRMGATNVFHPGASGGGNLCLHAAVYCCANQMLIG